MRERTLDHRRACERIPPGLRWESKPALRRGLCLFRGRLRERECEAELRGTHSQAELGNDIGLMGALLPFVLRVVAGACVGRGSGQPRMPPRERQHEGLGGLGDSFAVGLGAVAGACVDHGSGQARMPPQERRHEEVFGLGDSFTHPELGNDIGLMGALLPFVLRVVAGACVGRGSGQPRMPPRERQHEGLGGMGGLFHMHWSDATRIDALFGFVADAVAVCFEGSCGSMCWPRERV